MILSFNKNMQNVALWLILVLSTPDTDKHIELVLALYASLPTCEEPSTATIISEVKR